MNQREKIWAAIFGLVILYWFGKPVFESWFVEPVTDRRTRRTELKESVDNLELRDLQLLAAQANVHNETARALPPNELVAQRLYQEWVTELANIYRFQDLEVKPEGRSSSKKVYSSVRVGVSAAANYEQLCRFLTAFENADILHRISSLHLECDQHRGNPLIEMTLSAEALTMPDSPMRDSVFPRFYLKQELAAGATQVTPQQTEGFPADEPFLVRIGNELIQVAPKSSQQWELERGVQGTSASAHSAGAEVELCELREDRPLISEEHFEKILAENFFLKPVLTPPRLLPIGDKVAFRGDPLRFQMRAEGFPPGSPPLSYEVLGDAPPGFQLKSDSGEVIWEPGEDVEVGNYPVTLAVRVEGEDAPRFREDVMLTLKEPNIPPVLSEVEPQTAIPGLEFVLKLDAFDFETQNEDLNFSMDGNYPEGAQMNRETGVLTWTPPEIALPQDYEFTVSVTDRGSPPETTSRTVRLSLIEDLTRDTFLTGIISPDDKLKAMLYNRAENKTTVLEEGKPFEAAGVKGQVLMIGRDFVLWQSEDSLWQLYLGKDLHSRSKAAIPGL
jgi:hypothetical protein